MNTQSNATHESPLESREIAPVMQSATRPFYWSVRRELWENRSLYIAPLAAAGVILFGHLISVIRLPAKMRAFSNLDVPQQHEIVTKHYVFASGLLMAVALVVGVFYCLDALYGERRDRSILFWKSLPVSDVTTVLSKASIPLVVLPLLTVALTVATQVMMLMPSLVVLLGAGIRVAPYLTELSLFQMSAGLFYHLFTVHVLLHAPFYCWFLLVSAWARRAPFLWAFLPPLALCVVEKIAFGSSHLADMLLSQLSGGSEAVPMSGRMPMEAGMQFTPGHFLLNPGLWIGLVVAAIFLAAAVRLRHNREPI